MDVVITATNTGSAPWSRGVKLAYHLGAESRTLLWDGLRTNLGRVVGAGDTIEVRANVRAPQEPGRYKFTFDLVQEGRYVLEIDLVQEGVAWFADQGNAPLARVVEVSP